MAFAKGRTIVVKPGKTAERQWGAEQCPAADPLRGIAATLA